MQFMTFARFTMLSCVAGAALLSGCRTFDDGKGTYTTLELRNTLSMVRDSEPVEISLTEVRSRYPAFDEKDFSVHLLPSTWYEDGDPLLATNVPPELPAQVIDRDFNGTADTLLVICDFAAGEKRPIVVCTPRFSSLAKKIGPRVAGGLYVRETMRREGGTLKAEGKYTPVPNAVLDPGHMKGDGLYQYGGPIFETDNGGWRFNLDSRLCFDVIGKHERGMYLQTAGTEPIDLTATRWGGSLLGEPDQFGAGAFGAAEGGTVVPISGFDSAQYRLVRNGPAAVESEFLILGARLGRESFDLRWRTLFCGGGKVMRHDVNVSRTGHHLAYAMNADGLRQELTSGQLGWMRVSSYGPTNLTSARGGALGLGIIADPRTALGFVKNPGDVIGVEFDSNARNFTFYTVAAWDQEPAPTGVRSSVEFQELLDELAQRIDHPIKAWNLEKKVGSN